MINKKIKDMTKEEYELFKEQEYEALKRRAQQIVDKLNEGSVVTAGSMALWLYQEIEKHMMPRQMREEWEDD